MLFAKDKEYRFSFEKYREDCAKNQLPMGGWAQEINGAKVHVKDDLTMGITHCFIGPPLVTIINGVPHKQREEDARLINPEWCEEV